MNDGLDNQGVIQALAFDGYVVYVGTSDGNLLRLSGEEWESMHTLGAEGLWINVIGVEPSGVVFLGTSQGLYRMDMEGDNKGNALVQLGANLGITSLVTALTVHHNKRIFFGTTRALYCIDAGGKIKQMGGGASALAVTNDGEIFTGSSDGIRHSNDGGAYWAKVGPEVFVYSLIVLN
jgi:outer membrane protein assembly factor BamB